MSDVHLQQILLDMGHPNILILNYLMAGGHPATAQVRIVVIWSDPQANSRCTLLAIKRNES
jgi:hypothetical protein